MALHKVTASFEVEIECEDPADIQSILQEHQPYINASGDTHGKYTAKSKMKSIRVLSTVQ